MKTFVVAMWAIVASASTEYMHDKSEIGISSGYGGAFSYIPASIVITSNKYLQSDAASPIIDPNTNPFSNVAVSNGYGGAYGYSSTPTVNVKKDFPATLAISSGYGGAYGYILTQNVTPNRKPLNTVAISSGYGGAYGYGLPGSVVHVSDDLKADVTSLNGYGFTLKAVNVQSQSRSGVATSIGYGAAYDYAPIPRLIDINKDLLSNDSISDSKDEVHSPELTVNVNEQKTEMQQDLKTIKVVPVPQMVLSYLPGYSGYGNRISSVSGYSRYPEHPGYGFAYASGWL